ncbi:hypothetical protein V8G54_009514, partial [Vigna mungo]
MPIFSVISSAESLAPSPALAMMSKIPSSFAVLTERGNAILDTMFRAKKRPSCSSSTCLSCMASPLLISSDGAMMILSDRMNKRNLYIYIYIERERERGKGAKKCYVDW